LSSYLFAWLLFLGLALGSMANVMLHSLTGGAWFAPVRPFFLAGTRLVPVAAVLGIPVLVGMGRIYPWVHGEGTWWLSSGFFVMRSVFYLVLWSALALLFIRGRNEKALSAIGLLLYSFTISLAAVDWIGSLVPRWFSTGFGLVVGIGQMHGAMALAVACAGLGRRRETDARARQEFQDLGNLLLMYVMIWAYLAYMEFLIIWVGNLPREIAWYVPRLQTGWVGLAIFLVVFHFCLPLAILLSRSAKRSPLLLGSVAAAMVAVYAANVYWLVAPSVRPDGFSIAWSDPLALAAAAGLWLLLWRPARA
jgi:hypothetical protein